MAKKKSEKKSKPKSAEKPAQAIVHIVGESPMVEEYAELCASRGYAVVVQWNEAPTPLPKFQSPAIKRSSAIARHTSLGIELTNTNIEQKKKNLQQLDKALDATSAMLSTSLTVTATEQTTWIQQRHRLVGISALPSLIQKPLVEVAPTVFSPKETLDVVERFFHSIGKETAVVQDRVGMVLPRILCQIINEAAFAIQEDVASAQDIDIAMKLGVNYPHGPIAWADSIGLRQVYAVLSALENDLKEDRYRVSPLLKQMAQSGVWWKQD